MNLKKTVQKHNLYSEYVDVLNGVLQLSKRESEVFSFLLAADAQGEHLNINARHIRSALRQHLGISESNLSLYLSTLKKLNLIVRNTDRKWVINNMMRPTIYELKREDESVEKLVEVTVTLVVDEDSRNNYKEFSQEV